MWISQTPVARILSSLAFLRRIGCERTYSYLGGHHSISRGGGGDWSFCCGQILYFNLARRRAENFKFYYMFMEQFLKLIIYFMQNLPKIIYFNNTPALPLKIYYSPLTIKSGKYRYVGEGRHVGSQQRR